MERKEFVDTYGPVAEITGKKLGVDPQVLLGQWGLETGWGKSIIPGTNNPGNIKDFSGKGIAATDNMTGSRDKYRSFATPEEFGSAYASLISRKYPKAVGAGSDATAYASALKNGGYAEDPGYVKKIASAANKVLDFFIPSANASENDPFAGYQALKKAAPKPVAADDPFAGYTPPAKTKNVPVAADDPFAGYQAPKKAAPEPGWFEPGSKSEAAVRGFSQGATLGFGDEIQAGIRAGVDKLTGGTDKSFTDQYAQYRDEERNANKAAAATNTGSYMAGNVVGMAPSAIASAPTAVSGRLATAGGAAYGTATGFGNAEGSAGDQALQTITGTATGGAVGAVSNVAAPVIKQVGSAAMKAVPAAATTGVNAGVKEGMEWFGATGIRSFLKQVATTGNLPVREVVKPAITHSVPGGQAIAATATVGKGVYEGVKEGAKVMRQEMQANPLNGSVPKWTGLFQSLRSNPETADTAAQEMFTKQQTDPEFRKKAMEGED